MGLHVLSPKTVAHLSLDLPLVDENFPGFEPGDFAVFHGLASNLEKDRSYLIRFKYVA